jgi:hypothetical protein
MKNFSPVLFDRFMAASKLLGAAGRCGCCDGG